MSHSELDRLVQFLPLEVGIDYCTDLQIFLRKLTNSFGLKFSSFHFPAMEQFWPTPNLAPPSLESQVLPGVYYLGDASGVSFGVLQGFVTAMAVASELGV